MKTKRKPTEEQMQKAAERRERFRQLAKKVSVMPPEARAALVREARAPVT